jgi:hypothetical protein
VPSRNCPRSPQDGGELCALCGKHNTPSRSASKDHVRKVAMQHQLTLLCGHISMTGLGPHRAAAHAGTVAPSWERSARSNTTGKLRCELQPYGLGAYTMSQSVEWCAVGVVRWLPHVVAAVVHASGLDRPAPPAQ